MLKRLLLALALLSIGWAPMPATATAITNINLSGAISSVTRTSASGVTPMTFSIAFTSAVHEGYWLRLDVYSDSALTTKTQSVRHRLTHADLQSGATLSFTADGLTAIGATDWVRFTVEALSPDQLGFYYAYGTALSPTDAVTTLTYSATDNNLNIGLSNGNLTITQGGGNGWVRANRGLSADGNYYWEVSVSSTGGRGRIGVADLSAPFTSSWSPICCDGGGAEPHAAVYTSDGWIEYNGATSNVATHASSDVLQFNLRISSSGTVRKLWVGKNGTWLNGTPGSTGGLTLSTMSGAIYPAAELGNGGSYTGRFTSGSWTLTPPTGATAP